MFIRITTWIVAGILLCNSGSALGDRLQLANGDEIEGELIEMKDGNVKFRHEILGVFTLPRTQIHAIELGKERGGNRLMSDGTEAPPETPEEVLDRLINPAIDKEAIKKLSQREKQHSTPQDAVDQLRREGVNEKMMSQLHMMLPGFGSPKVQEHFQDRVTGLMSGSLTINDIREEAVDVRGQLKELMDELGPSGQALQGYYGILDGFIEKTDPKKPQRPLGIAPFTPKPIAPENDPPKN